MDGVVITGVVYGIMSTEEVVDGVVITGVVYGIMTTEAGCVSASLAWH